ncbi:hypothetical protein C2G38_2174641 [Gigaspora rosea]|uniref:Uncharacterized protein n=1 Tax=Gigaspora rosea TaxID=44941 RepID=A0A397VJG5_9GLOM|nr:hypothetical protein C2G38_2174641 [Gigaspora rosea]
MYISIPDIIEISSDEEGQTPEIIEFHLLRFRFPKINVLENYLRKMVEEDKLGYNNRIAIFNINDDDYLGCVNEHDLTEDPKSGYLDMRLVMYTDPSHPDDVLAKIVIYAIMTYPLEIFLTMPRILKEAYKLHYCKNLGIYHRPIPIEGTHTSMIHIIFPIQIYPDNYNYNEHALQNIKHIKISLHNFTNLLINQNLYRALLIGYFEKAWDCDDLPALIDLLFNYSNIIEDDKYDENSGDIRLKQGFDEMLHSLWPAEGVDQDFIASIAQNDISSHKNIEIALRDLLIKNNENKIFALFGYTHLYLLTIPSNNSIKHRQPLISDQLPSRHIPYEDGKKIK